MRIQVKLLRKLIREAIAATTGKQLVRLVKHTSNIANDYVDSVVAQKRDRAKSKELQSLADQCAAMAKWLLRRREENAEEMAKFAKLVGDIAEYSKFWNTPAFLNKHEHTDKLIKLLRRLENARMEVLSASKKVLN